MKYPIYLHRTENDTWSGFVGVILRVILRLMLSLTLVALSLRIVNTCVRKGERYPVRQPLMTIKMMKCAGAVVGMSLRLCEE